VAALAFALDLPLDLAFAATDVISIAAAQMKTTATDLPTDEGAAPGATRRVHIAPIRLLALRTAQSQTSARIPIVSSWPVEPTSRTARCRHRRNRRRICARRPEAAPFHAEQLPPSGRPVYLAATLPPAGNSGIGLAFS
ncbi:MAG: hypothetical protein ACXU8R_23245, partial [Xanthobacteraceae bacterium]